MKKEIIYPIFLSCCQFAKDPYWKNVFEDLSYGKCPYGTYISKDFFCCSYKDKQFSYKIDKKDSFKIFTDIYNLLSKKMGILSNIELIKKRENFHKKEELIKESRNEWSKIKKKNIKDVLIERYVVDMKNKHSLTTKQAKYLLSFINTSSVFKLIKTSDIKYYDNKIHSIKGIEFSDKNIILNSEIFNIVTSIDKYEAENKKKKLSDNWPKYINELKKSKR